jgi:hypothetical protein
MTAIRLKRPISHVLFAFAVAIAATSTAIAQGQVQAPASGQAKPYTAEQQQLCQDDAMRLCGDAVPDVERVTACMRVKKASLSPNCKAVFDK